jgi:hypothetical protein
MAQKNEGKDADKEVWASPEFQKLSEGLTQVLKVPKAEIERREAEEKAKKGK